MFVRLWMMREWFMFDVCYVMDDEGRVMFDVCYVMDVEGRVYV